MGEQKQNNGETMGEQWEKYRGTIVGQSENNGRRMGGRREKKAEIIREQ